MSMNQYIVKTPGRPMGRGHKSHTNMFHGGTIFCDTTSKYIMLTTRFHWVHVKLSTPNSNLRNGHRNKLGSLSNIITVIMGCFQLSYFEIHVRKNVRHNLSGHRNQTPKCRG